jgi:pentatricopeptide repeat protein
MVQFDVKPTGPVYNALVKLTAAQNDPVKAKSIFDKMMSLGHAPNTETLESLIQLFALFPLVGISIIINSQTYILVSDT